MKLKTNYLFRTFRKFSNFAEYSTNNLQNELNEHKKKIMSRGLPQKKPIDGVKHIILVSSGKGGVGKSTTSVNLALALKQLDETKTIGLLDSDVFGPSIPLMMNLSDTPILDENKMMQPLMNYGVKCMSMGFLIDKGAPIIWRGLMVMQALQKLIREVSWGKIDYLIIDTPPGTGDTHLSLVQNLPITGAILVTTPQLAALDVAKRGANMFQKLTVPVIGLVENMNSVTCEKCKNKMEIFGSRTAELAKDIDCEIIGSIPLEPSISETADKGVPITIADPEHLVSISYRIGNCNWRKVPTQTSA